jgi:threonylcarbamoyladenosine tRNA methylthiotransferase MtaB
MSTFSIENFGCRATDADASAIRAGLLARGVAACDSHAEADFVVLNTCTVTAAAEAQAREAIRKIRRANPAAKIVVTGCYAQRAPEELAALDGVTWVVGNARQAEIAGLIVGDAAAMGEAAACADGGNDDRRDFLSLAQIEGGSMSLAAGPAKILTSNILEEVRFETRDSAEKPAVAPDRTRPILKVQDGCSNRCAYCVIPLVRGRSRSLAPDAAVARVRDLAEVHGAKEIVLSGINLGSYGRDLTPRVSLLDLVRRVLDETSVEQLRFSSIEPQDITEHFVSLVAGSGRIAPHFHVPLQSGSDRILKAMHRWYRTAHYAERAQLIRRLIPDAAIGADVIVGFPGESDEDFAQTAAFIRELPFTYLHVFSFSTRPGTAAAQLDGQVPAETIRERARILRALGEEKSRAFRASQAGRPLPALTLARTGPDWTEALTGNYLKVRIPGVHPANEWHHVADAWNNF